MAAAVWECVFHTGWSCAGREVVTLGPAGKGNAKEGDDKEFDVATGDKLAVVN